MSPLKTWTERQAAEHLRSLELFGMRFGLDRMRRMATALGSPQRRFRCVHVLGTNGKTSTTRMTAAILERHGLRTAAYTSPHLVSYRERVEVGEREISGEELAEAVARAAWAAERVNRTLADDDHVTQFELLTAAALWAIAERGVDVAVIEAGLGGRYDATSVIDARVTALTNVGLEHTRWLGPTVRDIAEEKLAVLGVLEDKDAVGILRALLPLCERAWFTAPPSARALSPAALQSLARQLGFERSACEPTATSALAQAREWALASDATVLATGSVYLVGELLRAGATEESHRLRRREAV